MMVIFLVGLVSMILMRTLRKDYARYSKEDDIDEMVNNVLSTCRIPGKKQCHIQSMFTFCLCCRREIWEMNMAGSRYMGMCFAQLHILCCSLPLLAQVTRSPQCPCAPSALP